MEYTDAADVAGELLFKTIDRSDLYMPPKNWPDRAEDWYKHVNRIADYIREEIAQKIEAAKSYPIEVGSGGTELFIPQFIAAAIARGQK